MLNGMTIRLLLFFVIFLARISAYSFEYEQKVVIEGVLKRAERIRITTDSCGKEEVKIENSVVLVTDEPLLLSRSVTIGKQQIACMETPYSHLELYLSDEFLSLIGKRVQCIGYFKKSPDFFGGEIVLDVNTVLDCEQIANQEKTVFYEPTEVEISGMLSKVIYPGPPEYTDVEAGDRPEEVIILTLEKSIDIESKREDDLNQPEKGVRELQVVFADSVLLKPEMQKKVTLKGTLYHAHTAHHHRRVLMTVTKLEHH